MPVSLRDPSPEYVTLGRTGVKVCRIGIGGGSGMSCATLDYAISEGINYIFYSSDLHSQTYMKSRDALREVCKRGSGRRDEVVLAAASYVCDAEKILGCLVDQLMQLHVDHVDVFHWGWVSRNNGPDRLIRETDSFLRGSQGREWVDNLVRTARHVSDELRCKGYARFLGISTHDRALAAELANNPLVDIVMFRYNAGHRGAETQLFPYLPLRDRPGTIAFNTTHDGLGSLTIPPTDFPDGKYIPTHGDLYRFALDRPEIDVVLAGPRKRSEVTSALKALRGPALDPRLRAYLEKYGDVHSGREVVVR